MQVFGLFPAATGSAYAVDTMATTGSLSAPPRAQHGRAAGAPPLVGERGTVARRRATRGADDDNSNHDVVAMVSPDAGVILRRSPAVSRLCAGYDAQMRRRLARHRGQMAGLGALVAGVCLGALGLAVDTGADAGFLTLVATTMGTASALGASLLALRWRRESRVARLAQGPRLLRAVNLPCDLSVEELSALAADPDPVTTFFSCHAVWLAMRGRRGRRR